jgi:2-methylcitrate dehydratase PrpD
MTEGYTGKIAEYVTEFKYEDIPKQVVEHAKYIILDTVGAILAASNPSLPASVIITEFVREQGGAGESTVIGRDFKCPSPNAALANGTLGYLCDNESYHVGAVLHETAVTLPSALAVAEPRGLSGKDIMTSFIVGLDVGTRLSYAISPSAMYDRGFHPSAVVGSIGATISVGKILDLDSKQISNSIGLAATQSSGLLSWESDSTEMSRPFGVGAAARNGVTAALLAERGFGGPEVLEGKYTVFDAFSGERHVNELLDELGKRFEVMNQTIKRYSSCAFTHPGLDAFIQLLDENSIVADDIDLIEVRFPSTGAKLIDASELKSHNIQYVLAVAAFKHHVDVDDIIFEQQDKGIWALSEKVNLVHDDELEQHFPETMPTIITVKTHSGSTYRNRVDSAKGTPENPVTHREIEEKFHRIVSPVIEKSHANEILGVVKCLDAVDDINQLMDLLRFKQ